MPYRHGLVWTGWAATFGKTLFILPRFSLRGLIFVNVLSFGARACRFGWGSSQIVAFGSFSRHILKPGLWTMDDGRLTVDYGPFYCDAINHFLTSRIIHTPYETFLVAVYFLFLPLHHAINHFVAFSSRNLDARQRKTISCSVFYIVIASRNQSLHFLFFPVTFSSSTCHGVFFIYLQDMHQIKEVEPFQRYQLFCGIWQRKSISCCLIYIAIASQN